ncbi:MAG: FCD domain-containing protein [Planctomycetes bacterium]|nr:FCD domain-containing protein [Planctomycetota bacterium]
MSLEKIRNTSPKVPELVMQALLRAIDNGTIQIGEDLLAERELAIALGVGRGSLRECLAILEFLGVIQSRGNRKVVVKQADYIQRAISFLRLSERTEIFSQFMEFRRTNEVAIAALACARATDEDMAALQDCVERMERDPADAEADCAFHMALAQASHNAMFAATIDLVNSMIMDLRQRFFAMPDYPEVTLASHRAIYQAVLDRDKRRAKREMEQHLKNIENFAAREDGAALAASADGGAAV